MKAPSLVLAASLLGPPAALALAGEAPPVAQPGAPGAGGARIAVEGTAFRVTLPGGKVLSPQQLIGILMTVRDDEGATRRIRIDGVQQDPKDPSGEITLYKVSVQDPSTGAWGQFCGPGPDGLALAFPIAGEWKPDGRHVPSDHLFNMTCTSGAIGKCVRFGYKPWKKGPSGQPLWDHHQACVRMVRADYCGDGHAFTRNGTLIDVFDPVGIQRDEPGAGMTLEAGWGADGALCVQHVRIKENGTLEQLVARCPERLRGKTGAACTEASLRARAELRVMNRSKPNL